ncbi:MAG: hypothetical protein ACQXXF_01895 [Thermoplasmatota archaeon]|jgi:hypothetical protein
MKPRIIITDFVASIKGWIRSRGTIFWSIVFPVMLIFFLVLFFQVMILLPIQFMFRI